MHRTKKYFTATLPAVLLTAYSVSAQPTTTRNHVVSNTITQPGITTQAQVDALPVDYKQQQVSYVDGLGRVLQTVMTQANPGRKDIIAPTEYDNYGREIKNFCPMPILPVRLMAACTPMPMLIRKPFTIHPPPPIP